VVGDAAGTRHVAVGVREEVARRDRLQALGILGGDEQLGDAGVALADHPDLAVGPGLVGDPLDDGRAVLRLLRLEEVEGALRAPGAAQVHPDVGVVAAAAHEPVEVALVG
jgi:hypothetical protein